MDEGQVRLGRIRKRFLSEGATRLVLLAILWWLITYVAPSLADNRLRFAGVLLFLVVVPDIFYKHSGYVQARRAVSDMWAFGQHNYEQISRILASSAAIKD